MCRFHKDVAKAIATNPDTNAFDPAVYSVALLAMAKYRIEQHIPEMFGCDGYSNYEMATPAARQAFAASGLDTISQDAIASYHNTHIDRLRQAMRDATAGMDISITGLNLPKNPVRDVRFLDEATVELFDGSGYYTKGNKAAKNMPKGAVMGYVADEIDLLPLAHAPKFEPIRAAADAFLRYGDVEPTLRQMFVHSLSKIFQEAPDAVNPTLLKAYASVPQGMRRTFTSCATCVGGSAGGALTSHAGCVLALASSGAGNAALTTGASLGLSGVFTAAGLGAWYAIRGRFANVWEKGLVPIGALAGMAFIISTHLGGEHAGHAAPIHDAHTIAVAQTWLDKQPEEVRENISYFAKLNNVSPAEEALRQCNSDLTTQLSMERERLAQQNKAPISAVK